MTKTIEELNKEQVEQVRELFREYAKDNYLEEITTNEYQFEDYLDYRDKNEVEEFTQEKLSKGLDRLEIINELFDNYYLIIKNMELINNELNLEGKKVNK